MESLGTRRHAAGGILIIGSLLGLVGNALHPHAANADAGASLRAIADNVAWSAIHLAIIVAILLVIGGLLELADELDDTRGRYAARLAFGASVIGGALVTVSTTIDGFAMKSFAAAVAGGGGDGALQFAVTAQTIGFSIWSIGMLVFFGAAFMCFGAAVLASGRYPRRYGWTPIIGGVGSAVAALLQLASNREVQAAETIFLLSSLLITLWTLALGVRMWRHALRSPEAGAELAPVALVTR